MITPSPWEHTIIVVRHHYYDGKMTFEREVDHYEEWAAFAVEQGDFTYRIGNIESAEATASAGQIVVCPPGLPFRRHTEGPISFHYFLFHWVNDQGKPVATESYRQPLHISYSSEDRLQSSLSTLKSPVFVHHPTYRLWRNHVLLDLFRLYSMEKTVPPELHYQSSVRDPLMEEARKRLDAIPDEPISIGAIAQQLSMNAVQFSRRFQQAYGMKPSLYIERIKLDKVCHLLTHTRMTLEQIAQASGFNNSFYLSRYFSLKMKMSPSEYRNQLRV